MSTIVTIRHTSRFNMVIYLLKKLNTKTSNYYFFIPDLVNFLIRVILKGGMTHFHTSPIAPSYSMHIRTYIYKHAGYCTYNLGLENLKRLIPIYQ